MSDSKITATEFSVFGRIAQAPEEPQEIREIDALINGIFELNDQMMQAVIVLVALHRLLDERLPKKEVVP